MSDNSARPKSLGPEKPSSHTIGHSLPSSPTVSDFQALIDNQCRYYRQRHDHSTIISEELILRLFGQESSARQLIIAFIDNPEREQWEVYKQAVLMARNPSAPVLEVLHRKGAAEPQLRILVRVRLALNEIYAELAKRLDERKVGRELYRAIIGEPTALQDLMASLGVERIKKYGDRETMETDTDLRAEATAGAWKKYLVMQRDAIEELNLPDRVRLRPLPFVKSPTVDSESRWSWEELRAHELRETLKIFLPLLRGQSEELPQAAHQALREHFRKLKAGKRAGSEVSLFDQENRQDPRPEIEELIAPREKAASLIKVAKKKWGEKGRAFIQALSEGADMTAAAKAAEISRPTANKYVRELRRYV